MRRQRPCHGANAVRPRSRIRTRRPRRERHPRRRLRTPARPRHTGPPVRPNRRTRCRPAARGSHRDYRQHSRRRRPAGAVLPRAPLRGSIRSPGWQTDPPMRAPARIRAKLPTHAWRQEQRYRWQRRRNWRTGRPRWKNPCPATRPRVAPSGHRRNSRHRPAQRTGPRALRAGNAIAVPPERRPGPGSPVRPVWPCARPCSRR